MASNLKPGWCVEAGRAAGEAERGGGGNERITVRRPPNFIVAQRKAALERMRARANQNSNRTRRLARALDETAGNEDESEGGS